MILEYHLACIFQDTRIHKELVICSSDFRFCETKRAVIYFEYVLGVTPSGSGFPPCCAPAAIPNAEGWPKGCTCLSGLLSVIVYHRRLLFPENHFSGLFYLFGSKCTVSLNFRIDAPRIPQPFIKGQIHRPVRNLRVAK
jgi:hypothetical protein